jgi:7-cyano-7-deazaguanine synthase
MNENLFTAQGASTFQAKALTKALKTLVVFSGGMDSAVVLAHAKQMGLQCCAVHFQYGAKHNERELSAAQAIARYYDVHLTVVHLPFINELFKSDLLQSGGDIPDGHYQELSMRRTVVPFRNGIMLAIAAGLAESLEIQSLMLGNHAGDHVIYPDCRTAFTEALSHAIQLGTYTQTHLVTPFVKWTKIDIAKRGYELGVPFELTWSCYKGREKHCGRCGTCNERIEAFQKAEIKDPTIYESL